MQREECLQIRRLIKIMSLESFQIGLRDISYLQRILGDIITRSLIRSFRGQKLIDTLSVLKGQGRWRRVRN